MIFDVIECLIIGAACAAIASVIWQYCAVSAEFRAVASRFGKKSWAKKLLRLGPYLAERTRWTLSSAWNQALERALLTPQEVNDAVLSLAEFPGSATLSLNAGDPFDADRMEADAPIHPWVLAVVRPGLVWHGEILAKARVRTAGADTILLNASAHHPLTARLLGVLGDAQELDLQISRGALNSVLDSVTRLEDRDAWIRELNAAAPAGSFALIEPLAGNHFNGNTMESTESLSAPQHAVVSDCLCVGLRRAGANGEVLSRARVVARIKPPKARI